MSAIETTEISQSAYWVICCGMQTTPLLKFKDKKLSSQRESDIPTGPPCPPLTRQYGTTTGACFN